MKYIASAYFEYEGVWAEGHTNTEAISNCLEVLRLRIKVDLEIADGIVVPLKIADTAINILREVGPMEGLGLLIMVRGSHNSGESYEWRFFAVPYGSYLLDAQDMSPVVISKKPSLYSFLDCNSEYEFPLPEGSKEFIEGAWNPCTAAKYDY